MDGLSAGKTNHLIAKSQYLSIETEVRSGQSLPPNRKIRYQSEKKKGRQWRPYKRRTFNL
jgi:hypothetical protein